MTHRYAEEIQALRDRRTLLRRETWFRGSKRIEEAWGMERILDRMSRIPPKLDGLGEERAPLGASIKVARALDEVEAADRWLDAEEARMVDRLGKERALHKQLVEKARAELHVQRAHLVTLRAKLEQAELRAVQREAEKVATKILEPVAMAERAARLEIGVRRLRAHLRSLPREALALAKAAGNPELAVTRIDGLLWLVRPLVQLLPELVGAPEVAPAYAELRALAEERIATIQRYRDELAVKVRRTHERAEPVNEEGPSGPLETLFKDSWLRLPPREGCVDPREVSWAMTVELRRPLNEPLPNEWNGQPVCEPRVIERKGDMLVKGRAMPPAEVFPDHLLPNAKEIGEDLDRKRETPSKLRERLGQLEADVRRVATNTDDAAEELAQEACKLELEREAADDWLATTLHLDLDVSASAGPKLEAWTRDVQGAPLHPHALSLPPMAPGEQQAATAFFLGAAIIGVIGWQRLRVPAALAWSLVVVESADLLVRATTQIGLAEWALASLERRPPDKKKISALSILLDAGEVALQLLELLGTLQGKALTGAKILLKLATETTLPTEEAPSLMQAWTTGDFARRALACSMSEGSTRRTVLALLQEGHGLLTALAEQDVGWTAEVAGDGAKVVWRAMDGAHRIEAHGPQGVRSGFVKLIRGAQALDAQGHLVLPDAESARIPLSSLKSGPLPHILVRKLFEDLSSPR